MSSAQPAAESQGKSGTRATAEEIHDNVLKDAKKELEKPVASLAWSGLDAGLAIAFSSLGGAFLASIAPPHLAHAAGAAGYPLGFVFVVLARSQLFTENTLEPVLPLLEEPSRDMLRKVLEEHDGSARLAVGEVAREKSTCTVSDGVLSAGRVTIRKELPARLNSPGAVALARSA